MKMVNIRTNKKGNGMCESKQSEWKPMSFFAVSFGMGNPKDRRRVASPVGSTSFAEVGDLN